MKIALLHDWIIDIAGSEVVFKALCEIFKDADIWTIVYDKRSIEKLGINDRKVFHSLAQYLPFSKKLYRYYFFLYPIIVEQINLSKYDIIISSSHSYIKGVLKQSHQIHICYCHTPIRYSWDLYFQYMESINLFFRILSAYFLHKIRIWDYISAQRIDYFIANSNFVANRIKKIYNKPAHVIYPPVEIEKFEVETKKEDFYITIGRMVPYKKIDVIVKAFSKLKDRKLIVIGSGPEMKKIKKLSNKNVEILGYQTQENLKNYLKKAKAFIFMAEEDFGILPVESQACGTPVIAYRKGGVIETIIENKTGIFFNSQDEESLIDGILRFEKIENNFDPYEIRKNAERFSKERFIKEFMEFFRRI
ncbi:MAG: glycosyltransferase [candidate division WOR-3 bacterium]|nr:glycosyltransferase [candidate division WOR-3 bacterium]MCX7948374.1 glycosyltransferase [candidate division WOR-3 bacterium]MDW8151274.1 glycosyltransferase [candidate division WOR-3 bacterium]